MNMFRFSPARFDSIIQLMVFFAHKASFYLRAAPLPHGFTVLSLTACLVQANRLLELWTIMSLEQALLNWLLLFFSLSVLLCSSADAHCRFREYKRFKKLFLRFGFRPRLLRFSGRSRCQRDAMLLAARDAGLEHLARDEFFQKGYRWYHLIPDQVASNPLSFFDPRFLRSTFWPG